MFKITTKTLLMPFLFLIWMNGLHAQELDLFQATESPDAESENTRRPSSNSNSRIPVFTLIGTSRFGDNYYASLLNRDGSRIRVEWEKGIVKPVPGFINFGIAQISSRSVSLRLPSDQPCIESIEKGVSCNGNIALLKLSTGAPLAPRQQQNNDNATPSGALTETITDGGDHSTNEPDSSEFNQETIEGTNVLVRNPFSGELQTAPQLSPEEVAAREERRRRRAEQFRDFEIVRIPENDIPEGMQRIRTPFGDRLEPIEN